MTAVDSTVRNSFANHGTPDPASMPWHMRQWEFREAVIAVTATVLAMA